MSQSHTPVSLVDQVHAAIEHLNGTATRSQLLDHFAGRLDSKQISNCLMNLSKARRAKHDHGSGVWRTLDAAPPAPSAPPAPPSADGIEVTETPAADNADEFGGTDPDNPPTLVAESDSISPHDPAAPATDAEIHDAAIALRDLLPARPIPIRNLDLKVQLLDNIAVNARADLAQLLTDTRADLERAAGRLPA